MCSALPITLAVQQVAAKTRITTRRNILTPDILPSVWPKCWVQLIYSGGISTNLHVTGHLTIRNQSCGGESYIMCWSVEVTYFPIVLWLDWLNLTPALGGKTLMLTAWVLVKVKVKIKVSLTSHEGSNRGWNVWHSPLFCHSPQLWGLSCQLWACRTLPPGKLLVSYFR